MLASPAALPPQSQHTKTPPLPETKHTPFQPSSRATGTVALAEGVTSGGPVLAVDAASWVAVVGSEDNEVLVFRTKVCVCARACV